MNRPTFNQIHELFGPGFWPQFAAGSRSFIGVRRYDSVGLDQLIHCLSLTDEATQELRPLGESPQAAEEIVVEKSAPATETRPNNPRKLYSRPAA